jgi:hypothetical protein
MPFCGPGVPVWRTQVLRFVVFACRFRVGVAQRAWLCGAESDLRNTREDLHRMEERFTELCAAPFFQSSKAGGMTGKDFLKQTERLNALEKLSKEQELQIEHLQKTVRGRHVEYESVAKERLELLDKVDALQKRCESLQAQLDNTSRGNASLRYVPAFPFAMLALTGVIRYLWFAATQRSSCVANGWHRRCGRHSVGSVGTRVSNCSSSHG